MLMYTNLSTRLQKLDKKRKDSFELLKLMQGFTGYEPKMWGGSIIGFGSYHYKSERAFLV